LKLFTSYIFVLLSLSLIFLLSTENQILIKESKVEPGSSFFVINYGNLGKSKQSSLVCNYFNGYQVTQKVYWYSDNNLLGRNSCELIYKK